MVVLRMGRLWVNTEGTVHATLCSRLERRPESLEQGQQGDEFGEGSGQPRQAL